MSYTSLEQKLREEILVFPGLVALVGSAVFNMQLPQGFLAGNPPIRALTVKRVSTLRYATQQGPTNLLAAVRIQFTSYCKGKNSDYDAVNINDQIVQFLNSFCATSTALFTSPATTPTQNPNFVLNETVTNYPNTQPPLYMGVVDARIFNREDL